MLGSADFGGAFKLFEMCLLKPMLAAER